MQAFLHQQARGFEVDLGFGEWMSDGLVGADRHAPYIAFPHILDRLVQGVAPDPDCLDRPENALGVEPVERRAQALMFVADKPARTDPDSVEKQCPLLLGDVDGRRNMLALQPVGVGWHHE